MTRCVLLRHDLPDHSHHFDWLVELPIWGEHRLLALRVPPPSDPARPPAPIDPDAPSFRAELLPLHRATYLRHEGPIPGDRGRVTRVASGTGRVLARTPSTLTIRTAFAGAVAVFAGSTSPAAPRVTFERVPPGRANPTLAPGGPCG